MDVKPGLREMWEKNPAQELSLIVRVSGEVSVDTVKGLGCDVVRRCKLINGYVVRCTGRQAAALAKEPWVTAIELDEPVRAWLGPSKAG